MHELAYVVQDDLVWFWQYLTTLGQCDAADMQQIQNVNTEMKPNMQAMT